MYFSICKECNDGLLKMIYIFDWNRIKVMTVALNISRSRLHFGEGCDILAVIIRRNSRQS